LIKDHESLVLRAARDLKGKGVPTVGYGHTGPDVHVGMQISKQQAEDLLRRDLGGAEHYVSTMVKTPLTDNRFSALVSLVFNAGSVLSNSHLADDLAHNRMDAAAHDFMLYVHANGAVQHGLVKRRKAEIALFKTK
jgi:lysozyme